MLYNFIDIFYHEISTSEGFPSLPWLAMLDFSEVPLSWILDSTMPGA
jgi:hypothetical protein